MKQLYAMTKTHHGSITQAKNAAFNSFHDISGNSELKHRLVSLQECVNASIKSTKQKYNY